MPPAKLSAMGEKDLQHNTQGIVEIINVMVVLAEAHSSGIYRN